MRSQRSLVLSWLISPTRHSGVPLVNIILSRYIIILISSTIYAYLTLYILFIHISSTIQVRIKEILLQVVFTAYSTLLIESMPYICRAIFPHMSSSPRIHQHFLHFSRLDRRFLPAFSIVHSILPFSLHKQNDNL